jgi:hypothetical protein
MPITINGTSGITFPNNSVQAVAAGGSEVQTFNSSGTWTKPSFGSMARVQVWGGGGGACRSNDNTALSSGGGGGYNEITLPLSSLGSTEIVTIGAGGAGRTSSNGGGTAGGQTSFGSHCTAYGGGGGVNSTGGAYAWNGGGGGGQTGVGQTIVLSVNEAILGAAVPNLYFGAPSLSGFAYVGTNPQTGVNSYFMPIPPSPWHGGAGAASISINFAQQELKRGNSNSINGGAGGGGISLYGGNGGNNSNINGTVPGGGGFVFQINTNGGDGAAGRVVITVW